MGELLRLQGHVTIEWAPKDGLPAGTQRLWRFAVERGFRRRDALAFDWKFGEFAPTRFYRGHQADKSKRR